MMTITVDSADSLLFQVLSINQIRAVCVTSQKATAQSSIGSFPRLRFGPAAQPAPRILDLRYHRCGDV